MTYYYYDEMLYRRSDPKECHERWQGDGWNRALGELCLSQEELLHLSEITEAEARDLKPAAFS
jgi:hypothetical protein